MRRKRFHGKRFNKRCPPKIRKCIKHEIVMHEKKTTETKQFAFSQGYTVVNQASPYFLHITAPQQNTTDTGRIGDKITVKFLTLRVGLILAPTADATNNPYVNFRLMVFQYHDADMTPVETQLLLPTNAGSGGGATPNSFSPRNQDYMNVYTVVYDRVHSLEQGFQNAANYAQTGRIQKYITIRVPMKYIKKKVQFQAAGVNTNNGLWFFATTDNAAAAAGHDSKLQIDFDLHYSDA